MNNQDKEIFEKYCKLEEALRIAKDALRHIKSNRPVCEGCISPDISLSEHYSFNALQALEQIDEVLK